MSGSGVNRTVERRRRRAESMLACVVASLVVLASLSWGAEPVGAESRRAEQWPLDLLAAEFVHSDLDGSGVVVAVVDTDLAAGHVDLEGRLVAGYDFVEDRPFDPSDRDRQRSDVDHATMVAALIVGDADGDGITGIAPGAKVMPIRVVPDFEQGTTTALANGIRWAVDNGADVINVSIRSQTDSSRVRSAVEYAASKGVVVVASAGTSEGDGPWYPAALSESIAVGAIERDLGLYRGSPASSYVELVAPGSEVISASGRDLDGYLAGRGTSFAAPHVAATIALMKQAAPDASIGEIREALRSNARDLGAAGRDDSFGYGLIDVVGSVMWIDRRHPEPPSVSALDSSGTKLVVGIERGPSFDVLSHEVTVDGSVVATAPVDEHTVVVDLGGRTGQRVEVRSRDAAGLTSEEFAVVAAPVGVSAAALPGAISVSWRAPSQPGVRAFDVSVEGEVVVRVVNGDAATLSTTIAVEPGASPRVSVAAVGPHGIVSSWVEAPPAEALGTDVAPGPPTAFSARGGPGEVTLSWDYASGDVDRYVVERDGDVITTVSSNVNRFVDRTVRTGVAYTYSVFAEGPRGRSESTVRASAMPTSARLESAAWAVVTSTGRVIVRRGELPAIDTGVGAVAAAATPSGRGYWLVSANGLVAAHGDARWLGDVSDLDLAGPIVDIASTPSGRGYWLLGADGGVFALGDAAFHGSAATLDLVAPATTIAPTQSGLGYVLFAADGGVFAYGDAVFRGAADEVRQGRAITGGTRGSNGYLVLAADGGIYSFDEQFHGSLAGIRQEGLAISRADAVVLAGSGDGSGYMLLQADGRLVGFGSLASFDAVALRPGERAIDLLLVP